MENKTIEIISVGKCLSKNIDIPEYQRPYKWSVKNITDLLSDIEHAISEKRMYSDFKYRIGTVILHRECEELNIVDGQQRMISLSLLNYYLNKNFDNSILRTKFTDQTTLKNIQQNYQCIKEWFSLRNDEEKSSFINAMLEILEVVVIYVQEEYEAFQLFDSQNTRGRALDPHDLLKAYHLRKMHNDTYDMEYAVNKWESKNMAKIRELFSDYLFPICNWSRGRRTWNFTDKEIDTYKGVSYDCRYTFALRAGKAMPYFQITEPFIAGVDFFNMVDHYLKLITNIESELRNNKDLAKFQSYFEKRDCSIGMKHVRKLYKAALLLYYDRFHILDPLSLKKLFMWAFMLRIELENLSFESINKYSIGDGIYNNLPIFSIISQAWRHTDIGNLIINIPDTIECRNCREERTNLHKLLKELKR